MVSKTKIAPKTKMARKTRVAPKTEKVSLEHFLSVVKNSHDNALASTGSPTGCCQVQNTQTGGVFQIPTDSATCQSIGGVFTPAPC
jgi:hypothetical protein